MTTEQLRRFHQAKPFQPFIIHLADGRRIAVDHPEMMAYKPNERTFAVWSGGAYEVADLLLVTSLKHRNGHDRTKARGRR